MLCILHGKDQTLISYPRRASSLLSEYSYRSPRLWLLGPDRASAYKQGDSSFYRLGLWNLPYYYDDEVMNGCLLAGMLLV